jgi:hypothetical protein
MTELNIPHPIAGSAKKSTARATSDPTDRMEAPPFSLVCGGPLFQLFRATHLSGDALELLYRRVVVVVSLTWLPLLILSAFQRTAFGAARTVPFLYDFDSNIRFLVALPVLIAAELFVHTTLFPALQNFVSRCVVSEDELPTFRAAIDSAVRLRDSVALEIALLIFVYTAGHRMWLSQAALGEATWYANPLGTHLNLTPAGHWYVFFSIPVFQFILARWYLRLFIWYRLLWSISRLELRLDATHPDRAGGINFLGNASYAFLPILFAEGALLAGVFANRVVLEGQSFLGFKVTALGMVVFWVFALLAPLTMFTPQLYRAKLAAQGELGLLASQYGSAFKEKWLRGPISKSEELLGSSDIQSLADMDHAYDSVRQMRLVPFGAKEVAVLAAATLAPLLPLTLTIFSLDQLVTRLLKLIF